ncbi:MAG: flagellar basal-body MS-ring/collar protein FliF [Thermaerobacter sp.]|nr:flagellar basal-body MS-ring/collar protein FliF [Thermaerobacter sp.]
MKSWVERVRGYFLNMPPNQRVLAGGAALLLLVLVVFLVARASVGQPYVSVFTNLQPTDAAAIVKKLGDAKIPYRLSAGGTAVSVPQPQAAQARLSMAAAGLPNQGTVGFSIFQQNQLGMSSFQQHVEYLQALEGELDRTLNQMSGVQATRVELVLPKPSVFTSQTQPATAAVFLKLEPTAQLSSGQVRAVVNLVAHSVQGLSTKNVVVVDNLGQVLSAAGTGAGTSAATGDLALAQKVDTELQGKLQTLLSQVLGPGNVATQVTATLNFNPGTVTRKIFQPTANGQGILKSEQALKETFSGTGQVPGGVPGTKSNISTYPALTGNTGTSTYAKTQTNQSFDVSQVDSTTRIVPGAVRRLSVAVVVNQNLSATQRRAIQNLVASAVGSDPARQDQITVTGMPFNTTLTKALQKQMNAERSATQQRNLVQMAGEGAILAALLVAAFMLLRRRSKAPSHRAAIPTGREEAAPAPPLSPEEQQRIRKREEVEGMARQKPENVADIVRAWMKEE